jgi:hypothetical protein
MERKKAALTFILLVSRHVAFEPHWFISPCQKEKPSGSGKRERKSTYCCWTKKSESSIVIGTFVPGRRRSGLTFVLPYIRSEGRRLPSSETMRRVGGCWLCASAATVERPTMRAAAKSLRIFLLQNI